ncbi:MAG: alcohol dehydrogenase catalytic domain-containing protein [Acidobacteriota bacterium]|nr:alcohol dehydrogenase catalytic domain-containing protein [Acidobacteriota bacterium]
MRAFVQTEIGRFEERDLPVPEPAPGEAVVRVRTALTCGTDLKLLSRGHARISLPVTMGHELCGEVVAVGAGVDPGIVGVRVVPGVTGPCGACESCRGGRENLCASGHGDRTWGAFADLVRIPAGVVSRNLHRVPAGLSDEAAAFMDPLASVLHGWSRLGDLAGKSRVLVAGTGALAFLWAATARARGIEAAVAGRRPERAALARGYGAEFIELSRFEELRGFDVAVDATGDPGVWSLLTEAVGPGGRVLLFGGCAPGAVASFDAARLHYAEISLIGAFHSTPAEAAAALALIAAGSVDPSPLISGRGTLADLPRFLEAQAHGDGVRYAVSPRRAAA